MITCSVCHTQNNHLAVICTQCGGYLQSRVDNLDLFTTMWSVIEKPSKAFHRVAIAQHKNYVYVLSSVAGVGVMFLIFWIIKAAEYSDSLINIMGAGVAIGPLFGMLIIHVFSIIVKLTMKAFKFSVDLRSIVGVMAYAFVPIVISVVLFLPIKLMTFGTFFFSKNPSPFTLKPLSYILLLGMDGLFIVWSAMLLLTGVKVLTNSSWLRASGVTAISLTLIMLITAAVLRLFLNL